MCVRYFSHYLRCDHRVFKQVDTSACSYYHPLHHSCSHNKDRLNFKDEICSSCNQRLQDRCASLVFKIEDSYHSYHSQSPNFSSSSESIASSTTLVDVPKPLEQLARKPVTDGEIGPTKDLAFRWYESAPALDGLAPRKDSLAF